jgi:hypothetical protein
MLCEPSQQTCRSEFRQVEKVLRLVYIQSNKINVSTCCKGNDPILAFWVVMLVINDYTMCVVCYVYEV